MRWRLPVIVAIPVVAHGLQCPAPPVGGSNRFEPCEATLDQVRAASDGGVTCRQIVEAYLDRIGAYDKRGPALNAVQTVNPGALDEADRLDIARKAGGMLGP